MCVRHRTFIYYHVKFKASFYPISFETATYTCTLWSIVLEFFAFYMILNNSTCTKRPLNSVIDLKGFTSHDIWYTVYNEEGVHWFIDTESAMFIYLYSTISISPIVYCNVKWLLAFISPLFHITRLCSSLTSVYRILPAVYVALTAVCFKHFISWSTVHFIRKLRHCSVAATSNAFALRLG